MKRLSLILCLALSFIYCGFARDEANPKYKIIVTEQAEGGEKPLGVITVELWPDIAPETVRNFDSLVAIGFYNGTAFHRVIPGFMIQGGDPNSKSLPQNMWGQGDKSQRTIKAEFSSTNHERGVLSMARKGGDNNSATSQFFICHDEATHLNGQYTAFGKVLTGMETVDAICDLELGGPQGSSPKNKVVMKIEKIKS